MGLSALDSPRPAEKHAVDTTKKRRDVAVAALKMAHQVGFEPTTN